MRGGVNLVAQLSPEERERGVISASTGNHGQSIAYAARLFGVRVIICVPEGANPVKVASMRGLGAEIVVHGRDFDEAREHCAQLAREHGYRYIHSGNEPDLIAGVATAALEILEDEPSIDVIVVPIGGGSGAAGRVHRRQGRAIRHRGHRRAVRRGAGRVSARGRPARWSRIAWRRSPKGSRRGSPFELPQRILWEHLDDFILVSDDEIRAAMVALIETTRNLVEAAGAASLAGALQPARAARGQAGGARSAAAATSAPPSSPRCSQAG